MKRRYLLALLMGSASLIGLAYAASDDPVAERQEGYKSSKQAIATIKDAIEGGDTATVAASAQAMAKFAARLPELYPAGSTGGFFNRAKGSIWTNFPDFVEKSKAFEREAQGLARAAGAAPVDKSVLISSYKKLTNTCMACHESYRRGPV